jgi:hypothetical protein
MAKGMASLFFFFGRLSSLSGIAKYDRRCMELADYECNIAAGALNQTQTLYICKTELSSIFVN